MTDSPIAQIDADERAARKQTRPEQVEPVFQSILDSLPMMPGASFRKPSKEPDNAR